VNVAAIRPADSPRLDFGPTAFMRSSRVNAFVNRLNWRAEVLIARNPDAFVGKRVLDLASHDGRFSYAALVCGAKRVVGVEARQKHVDLAYLNMREHKVDPDAYQFVTADLVEYLRSVEPGEFDTVLCFGIFSHLIEQVEVLREIRRIAPSCLIIDSWLARERRNFLERIRNRRVNAHVARTQLGGTTGNWFSKLVGGAKELWSDGPCATGTVVLLRENAEADGATIREGGLMAWLSVSAVNMLLQHFGFEYSIVDWRRQGIEDWVALGDYREGDRESWIARLPGPRPASRGA
jgi:hypothetical protein